jgi:SAM-dependent methyltransferase
MDHRHAGYWTDAYERKETGWQIDGLAPPIQRLLDEEKERLKAGRVAVVGCGRSHEPASLAQRGFRVVGVDFSPLAIAPMVGGPVKYVSGDVRRLPFQSGSLDYVMEQTCFCAIDPQDRPAYVREVARVLAPRGRIFGLFYEPAEPGNPPFATTEADVRNSFSGAFEIERLERPSDSIERRAGREWLALLRRRA